MELDAGGVQQARYTHGPGIDEPISMHRGGSAFYYQFDGLGSVTSLTDINENKVASYNYDVFGNILEETGSVFNTYKFTGREYDEKTGIYYYRARFYDAEVGRFLSKDPVWDPFDLQNSNGYAYVGNNPINRIDPYGNDFIEIVFATLFVFLVAYLFLYESGLKPIKDIHERDGFGFYPTIEEGDSRLKELFECEALDYPGCYYTGYNPCGLEPDIRSFTESDWECLYWYGGPDLINPKYSYSGMDLTLYYSYGGPGIMSIDEWFHFYIVVIPEKVEYKPGETAKVTIDLFNYAESETIWLGVSFKDTTGKSAEYDPQITITPQSATINQNEIETFTAEWTIPDDAPLGTYRIAVNAWKDDTFTEKYTDNIEWVSIFKVVPIEDFSRGYADNDFYYLASYSAPGTINVYDRDTLKLHTTISLPYPRFMASHGDMFVSTFKEACYPDGPTYSWSGIAVYDKADNFNCLKKTDLRWDVYHDYTTRQPMIDDKYIMVAVNGGANNPLINIYESTPPFDHITTIEPAHGDTTDGADDDKYVAIATAWYGYHQYVYEKGTWNLVADIVGPYNGGPIAFYHGDQDYLFIGYTYKHGRPAEYIKYDYHDLNGPYVKKVVTSEFEVIQDIIACPPHILISGRNIGETEHLLQVRDAQTDAVVANFEPTFDGWIQWLDYYLEYLSPLTITAKCPVDLIVTDPDGLTIDKQSTEIPGATYMVTDLNGDGNSDDRIIIPDRKKGDYQIAVIPEPDAENSDTYTLDVSTVNATIVLAESVQISDILDQPYTVESAEAGIVVQSRISLLKGWNLISTPLNLTIRELGDESVVGDPLNVTPENSLTSIYRYNTTPPGSFEKCSHYDDWGWAPATGSESFTESEPGRGYWVMAKNDCNLTFTGTAPSDLDVSLDDGWNCVGWHSMSEALLGEEAVVGDPLNVTPKNNLTSIYRYNSSTGLFEKCSHYDDWGWYPATGSESFTELGPGRGYWLMANNDCEWRHEV
jgi:RHS repeat-associated protein